MVNSHSTTMPLVLASSSAFRKDLLSKLGLPFECASPDIDETALANESAHDTALRLSEAKACALKAQFPKHLIIGSDQVALLDGKHIGKPLTHENAVVQLNKASGKQVRFYTGLCVLNSETDSKHSLVETVDVHFRNLSLDAIERYLRIEQPYWCAGSFKCEGLGISLFERIESRDPNTLIGLPLIALCDMLRTEGIQIP